jgi:hypothetical protein
MLLEIKPEYRAILAKSPNIVVDIPRSTPAHIRARLIASSIALCEKRSITPFEERCYQADATRFQATRPRPVKKQIANKPPVVPTIDRRHGELALRYRALSYDQIKRAVANGYSEDVCNALNLAELSKQLRGSATYGDMNVQSPRQEPGQSQDPTASLRDDDDFGWDDDDWNADKHRSAAAYHRALASKATSLERASDHFKTADLHDEAARQYPDLNASFSARAASKHLRENCL